MKRVALSISNVINIEINEPRDNDISLYVLMDEKQIDRNIEALKELKKVKKKILPKIRMVKSG